MNNSVDERQNINTPLRMICEFELCLLCTCILNVYDFGSQLQNYNENY